MSDEMLTDALEGGWSEEEAPHFVAWLKAVNTALHARFLHPSELVGDWMSADTYDAAKEYWLSDIPTLKADAVLEGVTTVLAQADDDSMGVTEDIWPPQIRERKLTRLHTDLVKYFTLRGGKK